MSARGTAGALGSFVAMAMALMILAAVLAWWGWRVAGPRPFTVTPANPADPAAVILASGLWRAPGVAPAAPGMRKEEPAALAGDTRLLGVFAERGGRGYALFRLPSGPRLVAAGQEVAQGATLVAVRPDGVTLREGGVERNVALRVDRPAASAGQVPAPATVTAAAPTTARTSRSAACTPPAGFKGPVLRLNAELFQGIIAKPETWTAMLVADRGALAVRDNSGFSAMLAMRKGDRLAQANGIALTAPDDVISAVLRPLAAQQQVRVTGQRDGQPREWLLLNAGSCPP